MEREDRNPKADWSFTPGSSCASQASPCLSWLSGISLSCTLSTTSIISTFNSSPQRYATPFWRTYDLVLLWLAMIHGVNGVRTVLVDYVSPRGWRTASLASLYVLGFVLLALGSLAILTFQPPMAP